MSHVLYDPTSSAADDLSVIVVGGAGKHSSWLPTFGDGTKPGRRIIARKDGTPIRWIADLRGSPGVSDSRH